MPEARTYDVEITQAVRVSTVSGTPGALAAALARLGITDGARITAVSVRRTGS